MNDECELGVKTTLGRHHTAIYRYQITRHDWDWVVIFYVEGSVSCCDIFLPIASPSTNRKIIKATLNFLFTYIWFEGRFWINLR